MNDLTRFEKLTAPEKRGEYKIENLKKTKDEVIFICNFNMKVTAASAYCAGERLVAMKETMEYGKFSAWIEKEFPLSRRTAYRYMSFYERLGCATVAQLENISPAEAL